jgi:DNA-binding MarR family transcriptional regulator/N-acetylglutamate synthase-like GNAT family acetyltransferase
MDTVAEIREFNRFYTGVIGVLRSGVLDTPYSLTEARVLFEVGNHEPAEVTYLKGLLDLDPGYLSRILARFEADGLITRERSAEDGRRQVVRLTPTGRTAYQKIDERAARSAASLIAGLGEEERLRLAASMRAIRGLLDPPERREAYLIRPPRPGDLGWVVHRHGVLYSEEYGWGAGFEGLVAEIISEIARDEHAAGWIAEVEGRSVGCVFCVRKDAETAQLRLLLVEPTARGMGIGARLVDECVRFAKEAGYRRIMLWTRDPLVSARKIYDAAGFELVEERPAVEAGKPLMEQILARDI